VNVGADYEASTNGSRTGEQTASSPVGLELVRGRPEVLVGAAFVGGVIAAFLLRRLGH
jgi:hypothetical protein